MLCTTTIPDGQKTKRWHFIRRGAEALGQSDRFGSLPLAVSFDPNWLISERSDINQYGNLENMGTFPWNPLNIMELTRKRFP